jgi:hypothetical protein
MLHSRLQDMIDEMLSDPQEMFVSSNSKHCALVSLKDGSSFLIEGDFSGNPAECEAEARRVLRQCRASRRGSQRNRERRYV